MATDWVRRVLVVEDQSALRTLVCDMLERRGWETAQAATADEALRRFPEFDPDAVITDIDLGARPNGLDLAVMLTRLAPHLGIVFFSSYPRAADGARAMGVADAVYLAKDDLTSPDDLVTALEAALSTHRTPERTTPLRRDPGGLDALTRHQIDTLAMIARGWSNEQIAEETATTVRAVERSISRIFQRLEISGDPAVSPRVAAAARYIAVFGPSR